MINYFFENKTVQWMSLVLGLVTVMLCGINWCTICKVLYTIFLTMVGEHDWKTKKIPNQFIVSFLPVALLLCVVDGDIMLLERMVGAVLIGSVLLGIAIIAPKSLGGGDIKLMAISGFVLGIANVMVAMMIGIFLAAVFVVILLATGKVGRRDQIPLGPFLCIGCYVAMLYGSVFTELLNQPVVTVLQ